ncbi:MAG: hypothetical protein WC868_12330 [Bacteroidales bacterium]
MKKLFTLILSITLIVLCFSCKKDKKETTTTPPSGTVSIDGQQSPMGVVGTTVSSSSGVIAGVSSSSASVIALDNGVSTYTGSAIVTNPAIINLLSNIPEITINGDTVSTNSAKFRSTVEGIESCSGPGQGILVKYSSAVGDTYPINSTGEVRTVVSKSTTDDYSYGYMLIKVMQVEANPIYKSLGVTKITYIANHKFGLVGIKVNFDDGTTATFPVYTSAQNP